jgi:hypothetical protein
MVRTMLRRTALLLCAAAACGQSDNYVQGGFAAGTSVPVVFFDPVHSAISGEVILSDASGQPTGGKLSVVVISTALDLCNKIKAHPDYFRNPSEASVSLALYAPLDRSGTFYVGRDNGANAEALTTSGPADGGAGPTSLTPFAVPGSNLSLSDFTLREPGSASGGFDVVFTDTVGQPHELYGRFKASTCDGFDHVLLP